MLALSTDTLRGYGLNRIFDFAVKSKYDGIDLSIDPKNFDTSNSAYIKTLVDTYKLPVLAISTYYTGSAKKIEEIVEMAKIIGCKIIVIQPPKIFDFRYINWLKSEIPKIRQKENISIALENSPSETLLGFIPGRAMNSVVDLKNFKHVCIDTTRVGQKKEDLIRIYKVLKKYLVHVHLSNIRNGAPYSEPQNGVLPNESFLTKLKQDGYPGSISIKVNPKAVNCGDDEKLLKHLSQIKEFYQNYFEKIETVDHDDTESQI